MWILPIHEHGRYFSSSDILFIFSKMWCFYDTGLLLAWLVCIICGYEKTVSSIISDSASFWFIYFAHALTRQQERRCNRILPHTFIGRTWLQRQRDLKPRTGAAYIGLREACLTPRLVMHGLCLVPHLHAYIWLVDFSLIWLVKFSLIWLVNLSLIWLVNLSLNWLVNLSLIWLVNSQNLILAKKKKKKNFTAYVCVVVTNATLQRHMWLPTYI
jgi:hypothetical protein